MATFDDDDDFEIVEKPITAPPVTSLTLPTSVAHASTFNKSPSISVRERDDFDVLVEVIHQTVENKQLRRPLFHLKTKPSAFIFEAFINNLPEETRAEHNCPTCRQFLDRYGDLCMVDEENGSLTPFLWPDGDHSGLPAMYRESVIAVHKLFHSGSVRKDFEFPGGGSGVMLGQEPLSNSSWRHFHIRLSEASLPPLPSPEKLDTEQEYLMLVRILKDNNLKTINQAQHLLHEKLSYSTSHRPPIAWLQRLAVKLDDKQVNANRRDNLLRLHARTAWVGLIHSLRSGAIGSLLGWVKEDLPFSQLNDRWERLADPTYYMRSKAKPKLGNVKTAEEKMKELGYTKQDLMRYHTAIDELPEKAVLWKDEELWAPKKVEKQNDGTIFGDLTRKIQSEGSRGLKISSNPHKTSDEAPPTPISFYNFAKRVIPKAEHVYILLKDTDCISFFTRGGEGCKSPFVFDSGDMGNTMSWYQYGTGTPVSKANLKAGWNKVKGIVAYPHMWDYLTPLEAVEWEDDGAETAQKWIHARQGVRFLFCLEGVKELDSSKGLCLFPSLLKSELHPVRQTVEAFGEEHKIGWPHPKGSEKVQVGGITVAKDENMDIRVRVKTTKGITTGYKVSIFS
jgi:hypothetical protein